MSPEIIEVINTTGTDHGVTSTSLPKIGLSMTAVGREIMSAVAIAVPIATIQRLAGQRSRAVKQLGTF